ncbi:MAG: hypothetical protein RL701_1505 [Pseudomonadota bacterium]|jgi:integrase
MCASSPLGVNADQRSTGRTRAAACTTLAQEATALTGLSWGEATALTWAEIEAAESNGVLHIRRSQVRGEIRNTTKTGKRRVVRFPPELALSLL